MKQSNGRMKTPTALTQYSPTVLLTDEQQVLSRLTVTPRFERAGAAEPWGRSCQGDYVRDRVTGNCTHPAAQGGCRIGPCTTPGQHMLRQHQLLLLTSQMQLYDETVG